MPDERDNGEGPERPTIIPIFGKRLQQQTATPIKRRMRDDEVQDWLGQAVAAGKWMIAAWWISPDGQIQYRRKNSDGFPHQDLRRMLAQIEEDDKIQAMIQRADIEARQSESGFVAEEP